jgi:hypothetical protein
MEPHMNTDRIGRVALVWRGDAEARAAARRDTGRMAPIFAALEAAGAAAEPAVFCEESADEFRAQLLGMDAVLVWVDPISTTDGRDRTTLDPLLREIAAGGVWVSAHPDVILKMGVKAVLHRTRNLGWGSDVALYPTPAAFRAGFPGRLAQGPRVLKQNRGNGGIGIWKVELAEDVAAGPGPATPVRVLQARRGSAIEDTTLGAFMRRCEDYFADGGAIIDQAFQPRLSEGMIRCYMVQDRVVGFGRQLIKALLPPDGSEPGPRIMSGADLPDLQALRRRMEDEWIPGLARLLGIDVADLPVIWDADFLYGPRTPEGDDTYVLCEINVSAVMPIPDEAPAAIAACVAARLAARTR